MKENYENAQMELIGFEAEDVITASSGVPGTPGAPETPGDEWE